MHRAALTCAATVLLAATTLASCSSGSSGDSDARLRDPARGREPAEGARKLLDKRGSGGFAVRVTIPDSAEAVRISVSCAPSGTWKANFKGVGGGEGGCGPRSYGGVQLEYGVRGTYDFTFEASAGRRWWVVVQTIDHPQSL